MFAVFTEEGYGWERVSWAGEFATREEAEEMAGEMWTPGDRLAVFCDGFCLDSSCEECVRLVDSETQRNELNYRHNL